MLLAVAQADHVMQLPDRRDRRFRAIPQPLPQLGLEPDQASAGVFRIYSGKESNSQAIDQVSQGGALGLVFGDAVDRLREMGDQAGPGDVQQMLLVEDELPGKTQVVERLWQCRRAQIPPLTRSVLIDTDLVSVPLFSKGALAQQLSVRQLPRVALACVDGTGMLTIGALIGVRIGQCK